MRSHSDWYAQIVGNCEVSDEPKLTKLLKSLDRIQGTPSYLLLLMLFARRQNLALSIEHIEKVVTLLINFFVRRNTTDVPATRDLNRIFMELTEILQSCRGEQVVSAIANTLGSVSTSDEHFRQALSGNLYEDNSWVCRFILCALEESMMTKENQVDLWAVEGKQYVWTIEHVFPQGLNIPNSWVDMIADGDKTLAEQYRQSHVHKLGNLTISGYNSSLGNKCFFGKT
ncbi:HNH endonuclease family protein [Klebsiella pneumoniae]|uniref:HNH endonuclease family protein n=1 Tax=Klebsiella pneumoniae TaxID=573 RepID=UPI001C2C0D51|nr:HNH endonuclease family protein [Klebsiella pneumoniae]